MDPISSENSPAGETLSPTPEQRIQELEAALAAKENELTESRENFLRAAADFDNYRRRLDREKVDIRKFANESLIREFLPVLDSFDQALEKTKHEEISDVKLVIQGVELVYKQLIEMLAKQDVEPIKTVGEKFDPNLHQAIQRIENSQIDIETVKQEFSKGYMIAGRLLRPAMVLVEVPSPA